MGTTRRGDSRATLIAVAACAAVIALLTFRAVRLANTPGHPELDDAGWALCDFRDAIYYPARAFLDGANPYDPAVAVRYPVLHGVPPYSPHALLLGVPFAVLPFGASEWIFFALNLVVTTLLARTALEVVGAEPTPARCAALAGLLFASRPGHWNLLLGQTGAGLALATIVAFDAAERRPVLAGAAYALGAVKVSFAVPLAVMMMAAGKYRALAMGLGISGGFAGIVTAVLVGRVGIGAVIASWRDTYRWWAALCDPSVAPTRVDAVTLVGHLAGHATPSWQQLVLTGGVLLVAVVALRAARRHQLGRGFEMAIVVPAVLASIHHQTYDALLLAVPLAAVMTGRSPSSPAPRIVVGTLCLVIALNYLAAGSVLASLHVGPRTLAAITTVDAVAVLGLLATYATMALAASARPDPAETSG